MNKAPSLEISQKASPQSEITAEYVRGLFEEFFGKKNRRRKVPEVWQCQLIAKIANRLASEHGALKTPLFGREAAHFQATAAQSGTVILSAKNLESALKTYIAKLQAIPFTKDPDSATGSSDAERFVRQRRAEAANFELDEAERLLDSIATYLDTIGRDHAQTSEKMSKKDTERAVKLIKNRVAQSLFDAGWKTVSHSSENGPVLFVTSKLLKEIYGKTLSPASLRSRSKTRPKKI